MSRNSEKLVCVQIKDSYQPAHPQSDQSLHSKELKVSLGGKLSLYLDYVDAQTGLNLAVCTCQIKFVWLYLHVLTCGMYCTVKVLKF